MAQHYNGSESANPMLDGNLQAHIREATAEIAARLAHSPHRLADVGYLSRIHPETLRMIRAGNRPVAAPETLDAVVHALNKLDRIMEDL